MEDPIMKIWQVEVRASVYGDFYVKARSPEKAKEIATNLYNTRHTPRGWADGTIYQFTVLGEAEPDDIECEDDLDAVEEVNDP